MDEEDEYECVSVVNSHTQDVKHVVWHPTQEVKPLCIYVYYPYFPNCSLYLHNLTIDEPHLLSQLLASASYDDKVCIYKEEDDDWECRATLEGHTSTVWSLTFDPEGHRLASCSDDRTVKIWKESSPGDGENMGLCMIFIGLQ